MKDFLLGEDGDLIIEDGDLLTGQSDDQNVTLILGSVVGSWKQYPLLGVGIDLEISSNVADNRLKRLIRLQLQSDGYNVLSILSAKEGVNISYQKA